MKKIINRKMYNTDTAEQIAEYSFSIPGNFHYLQEILYRKSNGEYFLYGEGGAASRYREQVDQNSWSSGETIIPFSDEDAKSWLEEHDECDVYIRLFGTPEE